MAHKMVTKHMLTTAQLKIAEADIATIAMWRANPVVAVVDLFNIQLIDYQAWMLQMSWIAEDVVWLLTRNGGKTVLASIYIMLRQMLLPNTEYWILGTNGKQSKKLFSYIEKLATGNEKSFDSLYDIYYSEVARPHAVGNGFNHDPSGHKVKLLNNSQTTTLNDNPDGNRGERGSVFMDEAGFIPEKSMVAIEPYSAQDSTFKSSTDVTFDERALSINAPLQRVYFSSASDKTSYFYKKYLEFSKRMFAGDKKCFVADVNIDIPLNPTIKGRKVGALLSKSVVEKAMATNPTKAMREYYNVFDEDGGDAQIIKSHTVERNSTFQLPELLPDDNPNVKYTLLYDPASTADNAVVGVGKLIYDETRGWYGQVVNMVNFKDLDEKDSNRQLLYPEQLEKLREMIVRYNGDGAEYENIHKVSIDAGTGGGGLLYSHNLMLDYKDQISGYTHRGVIDTDFFKNKIYEYPNAYPVLRMVEPSKWKNVMIKRLIDLMDLGLIEFPKEYNNSGHMDLEVEIEDENGEVDVQFRRVSLTKDQELALMNIDICKEETKMIHKYTTQNGRTVYRTRSDMAHKMHDDRFYVLCLFANELHELRDDDNQNKHKTKKDKDRTILSLFSNK